MQSLEHPDISRTLKTGYPYEYHDPRLCQNCHTTPIDEYFWSYDGIDICEDCMVDFARMALEDNLELAADMIGAVKEYV